MSPSKIPGGLPHGSEDSREAVWRHVLKAYYAEVTQEALPSEFRDLLERLKIADLRER